MSKDGRKKVGGDSPRENFSSMAVSEVCAESGGLVGLKLADPPSPIEVAGEGTVVKNSSEDLAVGEQKWDMYPVSETVRHRVQDRPE